MQELQRFRLLGGRFYQQYRRVSGKQYGPYWYCRSGWGKVVFIGKELPAVVQQALEQQQRAEVTIKRLEHIAGPLKRLVRGDVLPAPDQRIAAALGLAPAPEVAAITQASDLPKPTEEQREQSRQVADEVLSSDEKRLLVELGFTWLHQDS